MAPAGAEGQARRQATPGAAPFGAAGRGSGGSGALVGTVKDVSGNVVSVARLAGQGAEEAVVKVSLTDQSSVTKSVAGEVKDIAEGTYVTVIGSRETDGMILAVSVEILPSESAGVVNRVQ